jgi:hypothetical protein
MSIWNSMRKSIKSPPCSGGIGRVISGFSYSLLWLSSNSLTRLNNSARRWIEFSCFTCSVSTVTSARICAMVFVDSTHVGFQFAFAIVILLIVEACRSSWYLLRVSKRVLPTTCSSSLESHGNCCWSSIHLCSYSAISLLVSEIISHSWAVGSVSDLRLFRMSSNCIKILVYCVAGLTVQMQIKLNISKIYYNSKVKYFYCIILGSSPIL